MTDFRELEDCRIYKREQVKSYIFLFILLDTVIENIESRR